MATLSAMFAFGEKRDLLPSGHINPAKGIEKFPETPRERYLMTEELERLGAAIHARFAREARPFEFNVKNGLGRVRLRKSTNSNLGALA
jgi:hypothetical protein